MQNPCCLNIKIPFAAFIQLLFLLVSILNLVLFVNSKEIDLFCIVYAKTKSAHPLLAINSNVQYRPLPLKKTAPRETTDESEYDVDLFETINLLSGLSDGKKAEKRDRMVYSFEMYYRSIIL
jgi:hypothetical protein